MEEFGGCGIANVDQASVAVSQDARVPVLDYRLVNLFWRPAREVLARASLLARPAAREGRSPGGYSVPPWRPPPKNLLRAIVWLS